jgi:hypothetical protein
MRTAALVVGMFGGFAGVYFAQLLVTGTAVIGVLAAAFGTQNPQQPLLLGLGALAFYTVGIIGGTLAIQRPRTAAVLMLVGALGGLAAFLAVGPTLGNMLATPDGSTATPRATPMPRVTASGDGGPGAGSALVAVPFIGQCFS